MPLRSGFFSNFLSLFSLLSFSNNFFLFFTSLPSSSTDLPSNFLISRTSLSIFSSVLFPDTPAVVFGCTVVLLAGISEAGISAVFGLTIRAPLPPCSPPRVGRLTILLFLPPINFFPTPFAAPLSKAPPSAPIMSIHLLEYLQEPFV